MREIEVNKIYKHFKGNYYLVVGIAEHTETKEKMVVYRRLYDDCSLKVRPYDMFNEKVDKNKYPNVKQEYRFELVYIDDARIIFDK